MLATVYDSWCFIATTEQLSSGVNKLKQHVDKLSTNYMLATVYDSWCFIATTEKLSSFMKTSNERMHILMETIATAHSNIIIQDTLERTI